MTDQRLLAASFRYNPNLQQAAQQQSYSFTFPGCGIGSSTCSQFCDLYGDQCDFSSRLLTYEPTSLNYGEVVGEGEDPFNPIFFPLLRVRTDQASQARFHGCRDECCLCYCLLLVAVLQWLYSRSHCVVIFDPLVDQMGVGVWHQCEKSYYWAVNVADTLMGPQAITTNPIYEGVHQFLLLANAEISIQFIVSYLQLNSERWIYLR